MNLFVLKLPADLDPCDLVTSTTWLLETGAEFARFPVGKPPRRRPLPIWMTHHANSAEFVNGKLKPLRGFPCAELFS